MPVLVPTAYLPSVSYMAEVLQADAIMIEACETYTKQTCRNHGVICGPNGKQTLSIPVHKTNGNHTLTRDIQISDHQPWQKIHWRSIETAYRNSPFFIYYQDSFIRFYEHPYKYLLDLNNDYLDAVFQIFKIHPPLNLTRVFDKSPAGISDLRKSLGEKNAQRHNNYPVYTQVFDPRHGFIAGLSVIDLIFNLGPEAPEYLRMLR